MQGFICGPRVYEYDGWFFEVHGYCGPWPLRKDGDPRVHAGPRFWAMLARWDALSEAEQETHRVGGGCVRLAA